MAGVVLKEIAGGPEHGRFELVRPGPVWVVARAATFVARLGASSEGYFANSSGWGLVVEAVA